MSSTSPRQGLSKTLRSFKARFIVGLSLVLLAAVFSANALTANLNGPEGQQAGSFAATIFSMFSTGTPKAEQPVAVAKSSDDPTRLVMGPIGDLTKGGDDLIDAPAIAYSNAGAITIPAVGTSGPATPYPSTIAVAGFPGSVAKVTVTLTGLTHTWPGDVDVLLVGPSGQSSVLMSDAGENGTPVTNRVYTFDDAAINSLTNGPPAASGTYKPTNFGVGDPFAAPAPLSGSSPLTVFNGTNPNGTWSLYIMDDAGGDIGTLAGGWSMEITPGPCAAPPANMVAWYPGQVNTNDIIGDPVNNGAPQGALAYTTGMVGNAFSLNGASNVQVPPSAGLNVGSSAGFTIDAWINPANLTTPMPIVEWNDGTGGGLANGLGVHFWANFPGNGDLYINAIDTAGVSHAGFIANVLTPGAGTMQYVAVSVNKTTGAATIYINGGGASGTLSGGAPFTPQTSSSMYIGRRPAGGPGTANFSGIIDEVEVYNRFLTVPEAQSIFTAGANGKCHVSQIQFSQAAQLVGESSGSVLVTMKRIGANDTTANVEFATANGTAIAPGDYTALTIPTVTFAPGERTQTATVNINDDAIDEPDENFTANIANVTGAGASLGTPIVQTITIQDNDAGAAFTVVPASLIEGNTGQANMVFTVNKTGATAFDETVNFTTGAPQTATAGATCGAANADYVTTAGTLTFLAAETSKTVNVPVCGDTVVEPDETFTLDLTTTSSGGTLTDGLGTIRDDDSSVQFTMANYAVAEGNGARPATTTATMVVSRTGTGTALPAASVDASTIGPATATGGFLDCTGANSDFVIVSGTTINWAAGDNTNKNFNILVCQDTIVEDDETFSGDLSNAVNTQFGAQNTAVMTITNDDGAAIFQFNPNTTTAAQVEGTTHTYPVVRTFTVGSSTGSDLATVVNFTVAGATAFPVSTSGAGQDIQASGSVTFPAGGANTQNASITSVDDTFFEPTEGFTATLSSIASGNGTIGANNTRSGSLSDNDARPVFRIRENTTNCPVTPPPATFGRCQIEGNAGTTAFIFDIDKISGDAQYPQTVRVITSDGGVASMTAATAPSDYTAISALPNGGDPIIFAQGTTAGQFAVIVNGDGTFEDNEAFTVSINQVSIANDSPANCATCIGSPAGRAAAILNDDAAPLFNLTATVGSPNETVAEGSGAGTTVARFTITRSGNPTELTSIVSGSTVNGSAVAPGDFTARLNEALATFTPADTFKTFDINIVRDTIRENTETFTVNLTNVTNGTFGPNTSGTGTITDDEPNPNFALSAVSALNPEGTSATFLVTMNFPIGLTGTEVSSTLSCDSSVLSGNSTIHAQSNDFSVTANSIGFAAGSANGSTQPCSFTTTQDTVFEGAETFNVALTGTSGALGTISGTPQTATITNNDACSFVAGNRAQVEGNANTSNFQHDVVKTCDTGTSNAIVGYASSDGPIGLTGAVAPVDYTEIIPGNLNYTPATTSLPLLVSVNGDLTVEQDETYNVLLTGATVNGVPVPNGACGVAVCAVTNGLGTILNDDGQAISITGTITNFGGGAAVGVTVVLSGSNSASVVTNASGVYTFPGLLSGGNFLVTPTAPAGTVASPTTRSYTGITASVANANFVLYQAGAIPRTVNVINSYTAPGSPVTVPITLTAQGDEAALSFTMTYNSAILTNPAVACGTGSAQCALVVNTATPGVITVSVEALDGGGLPTVYAAGTRVVINVTFSTNVTAAVNTPIMFTSVPTQQRVSDSATNPLPTVWNNGFVVFGQGLEADVAPRNSGDNTVNTTDVVQVRRFVTNLDTPNPNFNEYQRADSAPAGTKGDGNLNASDVIQVRRYSAALDPSQTAGGPFVANAPVPNPERVVGGKVGSEAVASVGTIIRAGNASGNPGNQVFVDIQLDHVVADRVVAMQTSVQFDPTKLAISGISTPGTNPDVTLGTGVPAATSLTVNATQAASGRIGFLADSFPELWTPGTNRQIARLRFTIAANAPAGLTPVTLTSIPVPQSISDDSGNAVTFTNENGNVNIILNPTATGVTVGGRVLTPSGAGLRGATVSITANGVTRTVTTSTFGYYQFEEVEAGNNYVVAVASRRYRFAPRLIQVIDNLTDVDFQGQE